MHWSARLARADRVMAAVVAVTVAAEFILMAGLGQFLGWSGTLRLALVNALLLALLIAPPIYFLILRPLRLEYEMRVEAERRAAEAGRLAVTDALTGALNRRGIKARLLEAMAQAERYRRPLAVAMIDLDGLKGINDRWGHAAGDRALAELVAVVRAGLRSPDRLGRYGGDEFLLVLPETPLPAARTLTRRIEDVLRRTEVDLEDGRLRLSAGIGTVEFEPGETMDTLLERADRALYAAKGAATAPVG